MSGHRPGSVRKCRQPRGNTTFRQAFCPVCPWMEQTMRYLALGVVMFTLMAGSAMAATGGLMPVSVPVPLNQVQNVPDRVANARVTDADGTVIGAVQKVELRNGKPTRLDIALLGSENMVTLDASTVRYDADNNVVSSSENAGQLQARPKN